MSDNLKYLPFVLIALITLLQLYIHFSARRMRGKTISELKKWLDPELLSLERLVIYFSSAYCGPCKTMKPMISRLADEHENLICFDAIKDAELAGQLGARAAPSFVQVERGKVVKVHLGALTEAKLRQML